jgi:hypothetical protein
MHMLGGEEGDAWKLHKVIYGHPLSARRWYEKHLFAAYSWIFTATIPLCLLPLYTLTTVRPFPWARYPNSAKNRNTFPFACATLKNAVLTAWFTYVRSPHATNSRTSALNLSRGRLLYI